MKNKCNTCSHWQNYDGEDRCSYYHDSLCDRVQAYCNGEHYLSMDDGISLYALRSWLNRLNKEELELPLIFEDMSTHKLLLPFVVVRTIGKDFDKWVFHSKGDDTY